MTASYRFKVTGRVQGVGFRYATVRAARRLDLCGWVRNCADGSVEGRAQGEVGPLDEFRQWLQHGPPAAAVSGVGWELAPPEDFEGFATR